jgi:hypothetical protein
VRWPVIMSVNGIPMCPTPIGPIQEEGGSIGSTVYIKPLRYSMQFRCPTVFIHSMSAFDSSVRTMMVIVAIYEPGSKLVMCALHGRYYLRRNQVAVMLSQNTRCADD